jgi:hypothetical protein
MPAAAFSVADSAFCEIWFHVRRMRGSSRRGAIVMTDDLSSHLKVQWEWKLDEGNQKRVINASD